MYLPFTHWQPNFFPDINMSPYQDNLGRRPHAPLPMLNPGPYGTHHTTHPTVPPPNWPMAYGTYSNPTPRFTVPPPQFPMLQNGPHNSNGTNRTPRPSVRPPPTPVGHDFQSIDAIVNAFIDHPRAIMRKTNERERNAYAEAYKERFRDGFIYQNIDDFPLSRNELDKVANWIVCSDFDVINLEDMTIDNAY